MKSTCLGGGAALLVALGTMCGTATAATGCAGSGAMATRENLTQVRAAITCLVNAERVKRGLPALRTAAVLRDAAARHSLDMVRRGYFGHLTLAGLNPRARLSRAGIHATSVGENIAWGMGEESSPLMIVTGWMRSATHRGNILSRRFTYTGIGVALGSPDHVAGPNTVTVTQDFAGR